MNSYFAPQARISPLDSSVVTGPSRELEWVPSPPVLTSPEHATTPPPPPSRRIATPSTTSSPHPTPPHEPSVPCEITVTKSPDEPLGCQLENLVLVGVRPDSPADRVAVQRCLGMLLVSINSHPVHTESDVLNFLRHPSSKTSVTLKFEPSPYGGPGVLHHARSTPQEAYPPTYLHPSIDARMRTVPLPPSVSPLYHGRLYYSPGAPPPSSPPPFEDAARARSEAVCARAGLSPLGRPVEAALHHSSALAVNRTPEKISFSGKSEHPTPIDSHSEGDPEPGFHESSLPPFALTAAHPPRPYFPMEVGDS